MTMRRGSIDMKEVERKKDNIDSGIVGSSAAAGLQFDSKAKGGATIAETKNKDLYLGFV